jgi:hypothetical protein
MVFKGILTAKFKTSKMANFNEILNDVLGIVFIIIVFALAYAYLKPHRLHRHRMTSTLCLKISYLLYLLGLLIIVYLSTLRSGGLDKVFYGVEFFAFLMVVFVPTIGIFARKMRKFSKNREEYNYFFSVVNVLSLAAILIMYLV